MRKWTTGALALPVLAAGTVAGGAAPAGAQSAPLTGDLDGDGIEDHATLIESTPCSVSVELGLPGGGFGAARTYDFDVPGAEFQYCPDMGVIVDLGGDGVSELVLAWFHGSPVFSGNSDLLVLRDFAPVAGFAAVPQPSTIATRDLNADGLVDVYETTDQGHGFRSFLNTPSGELVPGPLAHCHDMAWWKFGDFDEDGKDDLAVSYYGDCAETQPAEGVAVVLDDGTRIQLTEDAVFGEVKVGDANHDGHQDLALIDHTTGKPFGWNGHGDGTFSPK